MEWVWSDTELGRNREQSGLVWGLVPDSASFWQQCTCILHTVYTLLPEQGLCTSVILLGGLGLQPRGISRVRPGSACRKECTIPLGTHVKNSFPKTWYLNVRARLLLFKCLIVRCLSLVQCLSFEMAYGLLRATCIRVCSLVSQSLQCENQSSASLGEQLRQDLRSSAIFQLSEHGCPNLGRGR
jgi:hypothetical protein